MTTIIVRNNNVEKAIRSLKRKVQKNGLIKELRDKTGAGFLDCKEALSNNDGNIENSVAQKKWRNCCSRRRAS